jgi:hypothetical protein
MVWSMNLSIDASSFEEKKSARPSWILTWSVTIALYCAILGVVESSWRSLGYRPSAVDSPALWKFWYDRAVNGGPKAIVLIGASRIQAGTSTNVFRERLPHYHVVQLAKYGSGSPIGILRKLAQDERFNGIVICDTIEPFLIRQLWNDQRELFEYNGRTIDGIEALTAATVLSHLAIRSAESGILASLKQLVNRGALPTAQYVTGSADRSMKYDFSGVQQLEQSRKEKANSYRSRYAEQPFPASEQIDADIKEIDEFVRRIQDRGGQVVFVRMPSSRERLALEEEFHPKAKYWNRFAAMSQGIWIHSQELPDARGWECPDDSHLDYRDAIRFTNAFIDKLLQRGVVTAP